MIPLDLDRLNLHTPYSVWRVSEANYGFRTEFDVLYRINISNDYTIWESGAYEFSILNENRKNSLNDPKLRTTIFLIIEEFFRCNPEILLYQCETGDNRQSLRDRLFLRWFNEYDKKDNYFIKVSSLLVEGQENYAAIIVQRNNPCIEDIIKEFDNFFGFFSHKPQ